MYVLDLFLSCLHSTPPPPRHPQVWGLCKSWPTFLCRREVHPGSLVFRVFLRPWGTVSASLKRRSRRQASLKGDPSSGSRTLAVLPVPLFIYHKADHLLSPCPPEAKKSRVVTNTRASSQHTEKRTPPALTMEVVSLLNNPSPAESQPGTSRGHTLGTAIRVPFRGHGSNFEFPGEIQSTSTGDDSIKGITYTDHHGPHNSSTGGAGHPNSIPDAYHRTHNSGPNNSGPNNSGPSSMARDNSFFTHLPDSHPNSGPYNNSPSGSTNENSFVSAPRSGYKFGSFSFDPQESRQSSSTRSNSISILSPHSHKNSSPSGSTGDSSSVSPPRSDYHMNSASHDFGPHDFRPQSSSSRNLSIRSFYTATDSQATISSNYSGVHSRYTSVSSCHSQPECELESTYQMAQ